MAYRFCDNCHALMTKDVSDNRVIFTCTCGANQVGGDADTLFAEGATKLHSDIGKYKDFISNASFGLAGNNVDKVCKKCKRDYMTMSIIGDSAHIIYTCKCGAIENFDEKIKITPESF